MGISAALRETQPVQGGSASWNGSQLSASSRWIYFGIWLGICQKYKKWVINVGEGKESEYFTCWPLELLGQCPFSELDKNTTQAHPQLWLPLRNAPFTSHGLESAFSSLADRWEKRSLHWLLVSLSGFKWFSTSVTDGPCCRAVTLMCIQHPFPHLLHPFIPTLTVS